VTKLSAAILLIREGRAERQSRASMLNAHKAASTLLSDPRDVAYVMRHLLYWNIKGEPYEQYRKQGKA